MNNRIRYALLFGVPGFFLATLAALVLFGGAAGFLWLFVFGDDPWPAATQTFLPAVFLSVFLASWAGIIACGYRYGKRHAADPHLDRRHLLIAAAATLVPILVVILHQYRVGNLGPKSDSLLCSDYCRDRGYAGSGMPARDSGDRSCLCYDASGNEVLKIPLAALSVDR